MSAVESKTQASKESPRPFSKQPLSHPFEVGETYANRNGSYEVVEIAPPKMTIRYANGRTDVADIAILARIWENLQLPPEVPEEEPRRRTSAAAAKAPAKAAAKAPASADAKPAAKPAAKPPAAPRTRKTSRPAPAPAEDVVSAGESGAPGVAGS